ncbi:hypothetical protein [Kordiimonas marina]|uniref:hypothetical protein n=1 Tax=Kordiimonas marina TaxID=2872312 RepID=UPI001FF1BC41|nr:hypothetical protein [Kordiimonas marina]MCJ9428414.1 hypothetical protein [Kordiimonas marina]
MRTIWGYMVIALAIIVIGPPVEASSTSTSARSDCPTPPQSSWTSAERWAWQQISNHLSADFNQKAGASPAVNKSDGWDETRKLSSAFIETILFDKPYRECINRHGIFISGAWFNETLHLSDGKIPFTLFIERSRFEKGVDLSRSILTNALVIRSSYISGRFTMETSQVGRFLFLQNSIFADDTSFAASTINGRFNMTGAKFLKNVRLDSTTVGDALIAHTPTEFQTLNMSIANIDRLVDLSGAIVHGKLLMGGIQVKGNVWLRQQFTAEEEVRINLAHIGNVDISGGNFSTVNLTSTVIEGDLNLGTMTRQNILAAQDDPSARRRGPPTWREGAKLILRNTAATTLVDSNDSWPATIDLQGFKYQRLGGPILNEHQSDVLERPVSQYQDWLARDPASSTYPYEQLASVLRYYGKYNEANHILFAGREHVRHQTNCLEWIWQTLLMATIGYGYGNYQFRSLWWIGILVLVGYFFLRYNEEKDLDDQPLGLIYSLDMLLPFVKLRDAHYAIELKKDCVRYYFYVHTLMGYVLATFLIAGLTGLTK